MRFVLFILLFSVSISAQETVNIYTERKGPNISVFADNDEVIPMTAMIDLDIKGMESTLDKNRGLIVIPAKSKKFLVAKVSPKPRSREMSFQMESTVYEGDQLIKTDKDHIYHLPFAKAKNVEVFQGYNGRFSHKGENALDFGLKIGDEVHASRSGIVYKVEDSFSKSCPDESCKKFNNYITIYHEDGTFAEYVHLKKNGASVIVGDNVEAGDLIGYSGNTGWSSGPHLHFMVFRVDKEGKRKSLKTNFKTNDKNGVLLKESQFYRN